MIFDCHCHLDLYDDMERAYFEVSTSNISVITMTTTPKAWNRNYLLAQKYNNIFPALGLHPELVKERKDEIELFITNLKQAQCVGEIGIDGTNNKEVEEQKDIFRTIIRECNKQKGKIVSIHSRRAEEHVLEVLEEEVDISKENSYIMHWYTGTIKNLNRAIELGCYFSINRKMSENNKGIVLVDNIPLDRLLLESDSPLISGVQSINKLVNDLTSCVYNIAKVKKTTAKEITNRIQENQNVAIKEVLKH